MYIHLFIQWKENTEAWSHSIKLSNCSKLSWYQSPNLRGSFEILVVLGILKVSYLRTKHIFHLGGFLHWYLVVGQTWLMTNMNFMLNLRERINQYGNFNFGYMLLEKNYGDILMALLQPQQMLLNWLNGRLKMLEWCIGSLVHVSLNIVLNLYPYKIAQINNVGVFEKVLCLNKFS